MRILLTLFVLLFSSSVFAENFYCNVKAHEFSENKWKDLPDNVFLIKYNNQNLIMTDTMINFDWNFEIVKYDDDHLSGIIATKAEYGISPYLETIFFNKKKMYIVFTFSSDFGITINEGTCYRN